MAKVRLKLSDESGASVEEIDGNFTVDDAPLLKQYLEQMKRVRDAALVVKGVPFITNMTWSAGGPMKFTAGEFSNGDLYELLHVLRPLILESEVASFHKTLALLGHRFKNKTYALHQKAVRRLFEEGELSMYMQLSVNGQKLFDQSLLHTWLNGTQYHTDAGKAAAWTKLESALTSENARAIVISQLHSRVKALFILEHDVRLIVEKCADDA
jgi:hypothetical protein